MFEGKFVLNPSGDVELEWFCPREGTRYTASFHPRLWTMLEGPSPSKEWQDIRFRLFIPGAEGKPKPESMWPDLDEEKIGAMVQLEARVTYLEGARATHATDIENLTRRIFELETWRDKLGRAASR